MINYDVAGKWNMDHDGWQGTLLINPSDQLENEIDGGCEYHYYVIDGTYTLSPTFNDLAVSGTLGGRDGNVRSGESCPQADHLLQFTIAFPNAAPQPFTGYVFTHQPQRLAGYTWWQGTPFGWYAEKVG
jgi:hypothetical protein